MAFSEVQNPLDLGHAIFANLKHLWTFNEGSGSTVADSQGSNTGTLGTGVTWNGDYLNFAGTGQVTLASSGTLLITDGWTIAWRCKPTTTGSTRMVFGDRTNTTDYIWFNSSTGLRIVCGTTVSWTGLPGNRSEFNSYVLTCENIGGGLSRFTLYENGTLIGVSPNQANAGLDFIYDSIGNGYTATTFAYQGDISWLGVWDRILSQSEAAQLVPGGLSATNSAPTASSVSVSGSPVVGATLTGSYTYNDADGDAEGVSTFRWLRDDVAISGATSGTYVLDAADLGATIKFEVTPVAATGESPGSPVASSGVGPVVTNSITLTAQSSTNRVKLKNSASSYNFTLAGTYTGSPTSIEWRIGSRAWATLVASPSGGTFSQVVAVDATSAAQGIQVRFSNATDVTDNDPWVTIADDIYLLEVDSLAAGRLTNLFTHTPRTYIGLRMEYTAEGWNPADDTGSTFGKHWTILHDLMCDDRIIATIPLGSGGAELTGHRASNNVTNVTTANCGGISGLLVHGGANESINNTATTDTAAAWQAELEAVADSYATQWPGCKTYFSISGPIGGGNTSRSNNVREGVLLAVANNANCEFGSNVWWRSLGDGLHPKTDEDGIAYAQAWWEVLRTGGATTQPALVSVTHNAAKTVVTITFDVAIREGTSLTIGCFEVADDGTPVTISTAVASGSTVVLTLASAATGTITCSMGKGASPIGTPPQAATALALPDSGGNYYSAALPFFNIASSPGSSSTFNAAFAIHSNVVIV